MKNIEILIAGRPRVYVQNGFQRFLIWLFVSLGILFILNTFYILTRSFFEYVFISQAAEEIAQRYGLDQKQLEDILMRYFDPIKYKAALYSFFLSASFFTIARYCQKVINRNKYILRLETEWLSFRGVTR